MPQSPQSQSGFLLVDKPADITSHDAVDYLRKITGIKKIGHAGTLDPFATGLLIIAIGRQATKNISQYVKLDKIYEATIILGATTDSLDPETPIKKQLLSKPFSQQDIQVAIKKMTGTIKQKPPVFSAIKINGRRAYQLARADQDIKIKSRSVQIYNFSLKNSKYQNGLQELQTVIHCSSGTYIRSI
ncbi:tRNA pseudouridine(55) synthase TruB, partial [Candidatus Parcubacteria bacterium]